MVKPEGSLQHRVRDRSQAEKKLKACQLAYQKLKTSSRGIETQAHELIQLMLVRQEEDRRTLSRELHDEIAQVLSAINFQLAILSKTSTRDAAQLQMVVTKSQQLIIDSAKAVQDFARRLRPTVLDDIGLIAAAKSYITDLNRCSEIKVTFKTQGHFNNLNEKVKTAFFRVMQEALTNVARHSQATRVKVILKKTTRSISLEVTDNGKGFNPSKRGLGILGMQERMNMIGGTLKVISRPHHGTQVVATLSAQEVTP